MREPSVWTGQKADCTRWPSDAFIGIHKHLNHTDALHWAAAGCWAYFGDLATGVKNMCEESVWLEMSLLVPLLSFEMTLNLEQKKKSHVSLSCFSNSLVVLHV